MVRSLGHDRFSAEFAGEFLVCGGEYQSPFGVFSMFPFFHQHRPRYRDWIFRFPAQLREFADVVEQRGDLIPVVVAVFCPSTFEQVAEVVLEQC